MSQTSTPSLRATPQTSRAEQLLLVAIFAIGILGLVFSYADGMSEGDPHAYLLDNQVILNGDQSFRTVAPKVPTSLGSALIGLR